MKNLTPKDIKWNHPTFACKFFKIVKRIYFQSYQQNYSLPDSTYIFVYKSNGSLFSELFEEAYICKFKLNFTESDSSLKARSLDCMFLQAQKPSSSTY